MATIKQAVKAVNKANNAYKRDQKKRAAEAARKFKEQEKQQELANAQESVQRYNDYIEVLLSVHKSCSDKIDWEEVKAEPEPPEPIKSDQHEKAAQRILDDFTPKFLDKLFGYKNKIKKMEDALELGKKQDQSDFELAKQTKEEWIQLQEISKGVMSKSPEFFEKALTFFNPFSDISEIGTKIKLECFPEHAELELHVNNDEVIPDYILSLTKTGKLSRKDMAKGKYNELYQDYICSSLIRVARETMAYLPIDKVVVNGMAELVNTTTGNKESVPIASVLFVRDTISTLNLDAIDPSDSLRNFKHNMKFKKTKGFEPVEKISLN
mgnify:CR=1 FL=1